MKTAALAGSVTPAPVKYIIALDPNGRLSMKRDMEIVKKILLRVQERVGARPEQLEGIEGYDENLVQRHVQMLCNAGILECTNYTATGPSLYCQIIDMSWEGHDFLDALQNENVWSRMKSSFSTFEIASMPLEVMKDVSVGLLKEWARDKVGLG
jgi:hypothetical protein